MTTSEQPGSHRYSVIIIGGGPAGMHAALTLARHPGGRVALIDEASDLGGQFYKRRSEPVRREHGDIRSRGTRLANRVRGTDTELLLRHTVWSVSGDGVVRCLDQESGTTKTLVADKVIVATGAREEGRPFSGWTSPTVVSPGHAMHLAVIDKVAPAGRVLVAGNGPFLLAVAASLANEGIKVDGVVFSSRPFAVGVAHLRMLRYPRTILQAIGYLATLVRYRVPILSRHTVLSAEPVRGGTAVTLKNNRGSTRRIRTELLAYSSTFRPNDELHAMAAKVCDESGAIAGWTDGAGHEAADNDRILIAGDAQGVLGRQAAELRGRIAGLQAIAPDARPATWAREHARLQRRLRAFERYGALQEKLFSSAFEESEQIPDDAVVCRCECVNAGEIRRAARLGWNDRNAVKGATRAGMGLCQGRECAHTVSLIVSAETNRPASGQPARVPAKPLPIAAILKEGEGA